MTRNKVALTIFSVAVLLISTQTADLHAQSDGYSRSQKLNQDKRKFSELLTNAERAFIENSKPITVCSVALAAGSESSLNIVKLIAGHIDLRFDASKPLAWQEGMNALQNGSCSILPWATRTREREEFMNFTQPFASILRVIVTREDQLFISDISQYDDEVFAVEKGNVVGKLMETRYPNIEIVKISHTSDALDQVENGKVFASIASLFSVRNLFKSRSLTNLKIAGQLPEEFDDVVSLATSKGDNVLHNILQKAIQTMDPVPVDNFIARGAVFKYETGVDYNLIWKLCVAGIVLLTLLLWWNSHLSKLNDNLNMLNKKLEQALEEVKTLRGIISICGYCNNIRNDDGVYERLEAYISAHSDAKFSHGICPKCLKKEEAKLGI